MKMNRKDVDLLMGGEDSQGDVFAWREKYGRKVGFYPSVLLRMGKGC